MRKITAALVALLAVGAFSYTLFSRSENWPAPPVAVPGNHHLLVGFLDDANFRWRPYRAQMLDEAHATGARLVRALVYWNVVAPGRRPRAGEPPFVVPRLYELDELVASAAARHMQILFTIWGTPRWANGGLGPNHPPSDRHDLRVFTRALAARYPQARR